MKLSNARPPRVKVLPVQIRAAPKPTNADAVYKAHVCCKKKLAMYNLLSVKYGEC